MAFKQAVSGCLSAKILTEEVVHIGYFLVLNELVHEGIMGTGPDNKRGRGRLAPSRVYYQGRFP